jgi:hypothetical protein
MNYDVPSRDDILGTQKVKALAAARVFRKRCVEALEAGYGPGQRVTIRLGGVRRDVVEVVAQEFREKGWQVSVQSRRRGEDLLILE